MSLFVSSHYKNSPNDLQLMSDAPAHHLFVLLGPQSGDSAEIPDILAVIQVALEGTLLSRSTNPSAEPGRQARFRSVMFVINWRALCNPPAT